VSSNTASQGLRKLDGLLGCEFHRQRELEHGVFSIKERAPSAQRPPLDGRWLVVTVCPWPPSASLQGRQGFRRHTAATDFPVTQGCEVAAVSNFYALALYARDLKAWIFRARKNPRGAGFGVEGRATSGCYPALLVFGNENTVTEITRCTMMNNLGKCGEISRKIKRNAVFSKSFFTFGFGCTTENIIS